MSQPPRIKFPRVQARLRNLVVSARRRKPSEPYLSICAMYRDEAPYLEEWIQFHLSEGVQHFYLYDDDSVDDHHTVLAPWVKSGVVTLRAAEGRIQEEIFNHCLRRNRRNGTWMAFIDIDEFLFSPEGNSIPEILASFEKCAAVFVFWKLFGSGGLDQSTEKGVLEDSVYGLEVPGSLSDIEKQVGQWAKIKGERNLTGRPVQGKSIIRIGNVRKMAVHHPIDFRSHLVNAVGRILSTSEFSHLEFEAGHLPCYDGLRIHHYWSRSRKSLKQKYEKPGASEQMRAGVHIQPTHNQALLWDKYISQKIDWGLTHRVRSEKFPYIFVIGFNKTATRALAAFFTENGLPAVHWDENKLVETMVANLQNRKKILAAYDSQCRVFTDFIKSTDQGNIEGNQFFHEMDQDYPGSFFILNNRNTDDWLMSRRLHNKGNFLNRQLALLGTSNVDEALSLWAGQKSAHENSVRTYFTGNDRFLEIDISSKDVPAQIEKLLSISLDHSRWRVIGKTAS